MVGAAPDLRALAFVVSSASSRDRLVDVLVDIRGLRKHFGAIAAVDGVSFQVARGEVLGFLGPNGAGKTTTMRMLIGYLPPDDGTAAVDGFDVVREPLEVKRRVGYLPEGAPLYGDMTPAAFLDFVASVRGLTSAEKSRRLGELADLLHLGPVWMQPIETLSKGFKRRVGLAQAILTDPDVLILDEPTDGLDPNQKHEVRTLLKTMAADKAIVISTHILEEVEAVCTRAAIIARGRIVADATPEELLSRSRYHNAVDVVVPKGARGSAVAVLEGLPVVAAVEADEAVDGTVRIRALAEGSQEILASVHRSLDGAGIAIEEIAVERGRLDDVFRQLTTGT